MRGKIAQHSPLRQQNYKKTTDSENNTSKNFANQQRSAFFAENIT